MEVKEVVINTRVSGEACLRARSHRYKPREHPISSSVFSPKEMYQKPLIINRTRDSLLRREKYPPKKGSEVGS